MKTKNPWLGLESYKEGDILYGRDEDIRDLSQSVLNDTVTLFYGESGIGKTSILNAGIIPAARYHNFLPVLVRLTHKGELAYLHQIKDAIANAMIPIPLDESGNPIVLSNEEKMQRNMILEKRIVKVIECKDNEKESLYEYFHRHTFHNAEGERIKLLIIFDQFEEIFTLQTDEASKKRFFAELADFLNDVMPTDLRHDAMNTLSPQKKIKVIGAGNFGTLFNDLNLSNENDFPEYVTDNEIHMVFTIRKDFLSEFEYYSSSIPALKQNRYGIRSIHEEQAAQIIMRPMPGLINKAVAKLIIEKVTRRTDFELDGIPEIEVDSAVLSLYLNRLYEAKTGDTITSELVEQKGGEIITDFYLDAISEISESTVEFLENRLLNGNGRRDNISVFDAINSGKVTEQEIDILCNQKKILHQFNYAGDLRIEYVHDILCPVVMTHKKERLQIKQQQEMLETITKDRKTKRKFKIAIALLITITTMMSIFLYFLFIDKKQKECQLLLVEDESISLTDYWKANVTITTDKDTIIYNESIDKVSPILTFRYRKEEKVYCHINFIVGELASIQTQINLRDSSTFNIIISKIGNHKKYEGRVIASSKPAAPIFDAIVIIGEQVTKTNIKGEFVLYSDSNAVGNDGKIRIVKNDLDYYEGDILPNGSIYKMKLNDSSHFSQELAKIEEKLKTFGEIYLEGKVGGGNEAKMKLTLKKDSIYGYFYYNHTYNKEDKKELSYFLLNGTINRSDNSFHMSSIDAVLNKCVYEGCIKGGKWMGTCVSYGNSKWKFEFYDVTGKSLTSKK